MSLWLPSSPAVHTNQLLQIHPSKKWVTTWSKRWLRRAIWIHHVGVIYSRSFFTRNSGDLAAPRATGIGFYSGGTTVDPVLEYRLSQVQSRISEERFLKNNGSGNEIGFWIFDYPAQNELQVREHLKYLFRNLEKDHKFAHLNIFQIIIDMLTERGYLSASVSRK
jgi:DNA-directed RNA polymerase specialized sigma54-like protein